MFHSTSFISIPPSSCSPKTHNLLWILQLSSRLGEPHITAPPWLDGMSTMFHFLKRLKWVVFIWILLISLSPFCCPFPRFGLPTCSQITGWSNWNQRPKNFLLCLIEKLSRLEGTNGCGSALTHSFTFAPNYWSVPPLCTPKRKVIKVIIGPEMTVSPNELSFRTLYSRLGLTK